MERVVSICRRLKLPAQILERRVGAGAASKRLLQNVGNRSPDGGGGGWNAKAHRTFDLDGFLMGPLEAKVPKRLAFYSRSFGQVRKNCD